LLRHLGLSEAASDVELAVESDLLNRGDTRRSTSEVGNALVKALG